MKLLIYTANFGNFDKTQENEEQVLPTGIDQIEYHRFTENDLPLRYKSMTPRLQARLVKCFGWQLIEADFYLWVDSSCRLPDKHCADWFMEQLGEWEFSKEMAVFKHNKRKTVQQEADYLKHRLTIKCPYVTSRYENEDIDGQLSEVDPTAPLYASTAFIYMNTPSVQQALKEWWYHISRYHSIDQLSLPWITRDLGVNVIKEDYLKCKYLEYIR